MNYLLRANQLRQELIDYRRYIHQNAEVGKHLPLTTGYILEQLQTFGYAPVQLCESGVVATVGRPGNTVLLRAETDALPMREESGLPFASQNPAAAHTCGHDMHAAALLGAAKMLKENESALCGTVKLMFQPGEEILWGANEMLQRGVLENPSVDIAFSSHVTPRNPTGVISFREGAAMASCCSFSIKIQGQGAHGASPSKGIDPINIGAHIYLSLQELVAREVSLQNGAVLTIGAFRGGSMPNTIPGEAELLGTLRTFDDQLRHYLIQRIICVAEKTAEAFRGIARVELLSDVPVEYNDPNLSSYVKACISDLFSQETQTDEPRTGSDDFAFISQRVPSVLAFIGAHDPADQGEVYPGHHPKVIFDEEAIVVSSALYAELADRWLREHNQC